MYEIGFETAACESSIVVPLQGHVRELQFVITFVTSLTRWIRMRQEAEAYQWFICQDMRCTCFMFQHRNYQFITAVCVRATGDLGDLVYIVCIRLSGLHVTLCMRHRKTQMLCAFFRSTSSSRSVALSSCVLLAVRRAPLYSRRWI